MTARCKGCGAVLQSSDPQAPGYTPKEGSVYCQRCYRLIHYDDLTFSMRTGISEDQVLEQMGSADAKLVLWIVDLFDFEASMIPGISRKLDGRTIVLCGTKRDLLPATVSDTRLVQFIYSRLKEYGIRVKEVLLCEQDPEKLREDVFGAVRAYGGGRPVLVAGRANAGKSTFLNRLSQQAVLTSSRYPGTTLDFNPIEIEGITFIDTPGIEIRHSLLMCTREEDLRQLIPVQAVKPRVYQLHDEQSFAIGGLVRLDLLGVEKGSAVFYCSRALPIHRTRLANADAFWQKHYGELLQPICAEAASRTFTERLPQAKMDAVIAGPGWCALSGKIREVQVRVPAQTEVLFRKAML